jgi:2-methylisocitrate lyase-like PEP mutase family enzyme
MANFSNQRAAFRKLHAQGCFVIPNPWDAGSTRYLRALGFKALATTSAGFGFSKGLPDSCTALSRDMVLEHIADIVKAAGDLPVNADFQAGYAETADGVAESVRLCVATGVAGLSIEDATGDERRPLYELPEALDRLAAARAAIDATGADVLLTARAECFLVGHPDPLKESIRRLEAYAAAGADVLYAPGPREPDDLRAIIAAVSPKPVNVLVLSSTALGLDGFAKLGARRLSVGSALARAAWTGFIRAARPMAEEGSFAGLNDLTPFAELNAVFQSEPT